MTEKEKMLAGELYDCGDPELMEMQYNTTGYFHRR